MDSLLQRIILEDLITLSISCLAVSGAVILAAYTRGTTRLRQAAIVVPALCIILIATNILVHTDREYIDDLMEHCVDACRRGDSDALTATIDPDYNAAGWYYDDLSQAIEQAMSRIRFITLKTGKWEILPTQGTPDTRLGRISVRAEIETGSFRTMTISSWQLEFSRSSTHNDRYGGWRISDIRPVSINNQAINELADVFQMW